MAAGGFAGFEVSYSVDEKAHGLDFYPSRKDLADPLEPPVCPNWRFGLEGDDPKLAPRWPHPPRRTRRETGENHAAFSAGPDMRLDRFLAGQ